MNKALKVFPFQSKRSRGQAHLNKKKCWVTTYKSSSKIFAFVSFQINSRGKLKS